MLQDRALDHRRLGQHQPHRLLPVKIAAVGVGQLAEGLTGAVQHRLPTQRVHPGVQPRRLDALRLEVMEDVSHPAPRQPGPRL
eukprot:gene14204-14323_t